MTSSDVHICLAFATALLVTFAVTEPIRRFAIRTDFFDRPGGYKEHPAPTPYLGGVAVMAGLVAGAGIFGLGYTGLGATIAGTAALFAIGTIDDRVGLGIRPRLAVQIGAALLLWFTDTKWHLGGSAASLIVTVLWVVGLTNAFNLMDNQDGAAGTIGMVCAAGAGALALIHSDESVAVIGLALSGACAGFLPHNLSKPSRIFLGDGGSMPIGFLVSALILLSPHGPGGWAAVAALAPMAGLPILDTALVVVSRHRRRAPVLQGGRDHLTHRLLRALGSPQRVALMLGATQAGLCGIALGLDALSTVAIAVATLAYTALGLCTIILLDSPQLRLNVGGGHRPRPAAGQPAARPRSGGLDRS